MTESIVLFTVQLERRVNELTVQLDHALSQIHNLQQRAGERRLVIWVSNIHMV